MTPPGPADEALLAKLLPEVEKAAPFTPARLRLRRLAAAVGVIAIYVLAFFTLGGVHWADRPAAYIYAASGGWVVIAAVATWWTLRDPTFGPGVWGGRVAMVLPLLSFIWLLLLNAGYPQALKVCTGRPGFACLDLTLAIGAGSVLVMMLFARQTFVARPLAFGALAGVTAGAWTAVLLTLSCECTTPSHVALGHVLPVMLLASAGSLLAKRWLNR